MQEDGKDLRDWDHWKIVGKSKAIYSFGDSTLEFWFHLEYGFVRMNYHNYGGQYLEFEIERIMDR